MKSLVQDMLAPTSHNAIETNLLMLRQEGVMSDFVSRFKNTMVGIYSGITNSLSQLINDSYDVSNRTAKKNQATLEDFQKKENRFNFVVHADTLVPIPDGFKGNWLVYSTTVAANRQALITQALNSLEDFNTYLASFIGDKDSKIALQDKGREFKHLQKLREDQEKAFQQFFSSGNQQRAKLSMVFESKSEIAQACDTSIQNWKNVSQVGLQQIHERCNEVARKMERVINMMSKQGDVQVSKQALLNLSEGGYEVARQIEHLAKYIARSEMSMVISGNQIDRLVSLIK